MSIGEKILVVDDDQELLDLLCPFLEKSGYSAYAALTAAAMREVLAETAIDLILLDIRLPDADGTALLRELRQANDLPVIFLTGRTATVDRIVGLELGADDYIDKPFELRELVARVRTVLRRAAAGMRERESGREVKVFSGWRFDEVHRQLYSPAREPVELTGAEFELLRQLVNSAQRPVSRDRLLRAVQSREWMPQDRSIDVSISRLRKKLERNPAQPNLIRTIRNVGYVLASHVSVEAEDEHG